MTDDQLVNSVTVVGRLVARPSFKSHPHWDSEARFSVECGSNVVPCIAYGRVAGNLLRFGVAGAEVFGRGQLVWPGDDNAKPHVLVEHIAFASPREVAEKLRWFDRPRKVKS